MQRSLTLMDRWLNEGHKFIVTDEISIADLSAFCELTQTSFINLDLSKWKNVKEWYDRMLAIPEVAEVH